MNENSEPEKIIHYVGVGASAGGLEAIEAFFSDMPENSGLAFIVIQHLSPDHKSLMVELLSKKTRIPVHRCRDGMVVEPNHIYMIPPKKNLTIFHGRLILTDKDAHRGGNLPIDIFLKSLAEDKGKRAIAVILSGTGSDGTRGVRAIKEQDGMVMVQEEASAKFDGMPKGAISTGVADFVISPGEMAAQLMQYTGHPLVTGQVPAKKLLKDEQGMTKIFSLLRDQTGVDFTYYKPSTITRRIKRRLTVNQKNSLVEYIDFMQRFPAEVTTLYRELLIGVTSFFRDPDAMTELLTHCFPKILTQSKNRELRFWVAGCSTGEEAYTIAILAKEAMDRMGESRDIKIFATDIDRNAVVHAGNGIYPESIAADLSPRFLGKYFYKKEDNYQVARHIREMVVFAKHNLIKDPPFTKIDFISCRNLLIYLQPVLQNKVFDLFNFSLKSGGYLFLGTSETIGEMELFFEVVHQKFKLYRSLGKHGNNPMSDELKPKPPHSDTQALTFPAGESRRYRRQPRDDSMKDRYLQVLQDKYVPVAAVVKPDMYLVHVFGDPQRFFNVPSGKMVFDITKMVAKDLTIPLSTGIQKALRTGNEVVYNNVSISRGDRKTNLSIRVTPLPEKKGYDNLTAVFFEETSRGGQAAPPAAEDTYDIEADVQQRIRDLEQELQYAKENLQAIVEELETSNEELQATNEELLASNEELQSTNQELQSTNEELYTVNAEHQKKITELTQMNNDVENLLASSGVGILILDENNEVRKYSPGIMEIFNILESDIGRPVDHISHKLTGLNPAKTAQSVQKHHEQITLEVEDQGGKDYLVRVFPYAVGPDAYSGTIFTFVDISAFKQAKQDLENSLALSRDIMRHMPSGLFIYRRDDSGRLILETGNARAEQMTGCAIKKIRGQDFATIWPGATALDLPQTLLAAIDTGQPVLLDNLAYQDLKISGYFRITAFALPENRLAVLFDDITQAMDKDRKLDEAQLKYKTLYETISQGVVYQDHEGKIISANPSALTILGLTQDQIKGKTSMDPDWQIIDQQRKPLAGENHPAMKALASGRPVKNVIMGVCRPEETRPRWIRVDATPEFNPGSSMPFQVFTIFDDITDTMET
jgi:two-component system CheB/CheR fusion protein